MSVELNLQPNMFAMNYRLTLATFGRTYVHCNDDGKVAGMYMFTGLTHQG